MEEERLSLLRASINAQGEEIERIFARVEERRRGEGVAYLESLAYQLHNLYCAFEDMFKIIADFFENRIEDLTKYHRELLWRMKISIEGVRPALLSEESYRLLDSLRAFRHVFRHAYSYELDPQKVALVAEDALKLRALYRGEIDRFLEQFRGG
ncbi:MAG: ribonuclease toxin HepT-like protein [bacterium]